MPRTIPDTNHVLAYNQNEYYKDHMVSDKAKKILEGAWDLHVHCSPAPNPADVNGGLDGFVLNDFELVTEARQAGMRGLASRITNLEPSIEPGWRRRPAAKAKRPLTVHLP